MAIYPAALLYAIRFPGTQYLRVTLNGVAETLEVPVVAGRDYWMSGDGEADDADGNGDLMLVLQDALDTHSENSGGWFVGPVFGSDPYGVGTVSILSNDAEFTIHWTHVGTTLDPTVFGFADADVTSTSMQLESPVGPKGLWMSGRFTSKDTRDRRTVAGSVSRSIAGLTRVARLSLGARERDVSFELVPLSRALSEYATAGLPHNTFETAWEEGISLGYTLRIYESVYSVPSATGYLSYVTRSLADPMKQRTSDLRYWNVDLALVRVGDE